MIKRWLLLISTVGGGSMASGCMRDPPPASVGACPSISNGPTYVAVELPSNLGAQAESVQGECAPKLGINDAVANSRVVDGNFGYCRNRDASDYSADCPADLGVMATDSKGVCYVELQLHDQSKIALAVSYQTQNGPSGAGDISCLYYTAALLAETAADSGVE